MTTLKIGLAPFTSYINAMGADEALVVADHVKRKLDHSLAWWCYKPAFDGLRGALSSTEPDQAIRRMLDDTPPRLDGHYAEIASGISKLIESRQRPALIPTRPGSWSAEGLRVDMGMCLGLRRPDGTTLCALPYFNKESLIPAAAAGPIRLIELALPTMLPGARPAVLDVRTGKFHYGRRNVASLDDWLHVKAHAYVDHFNRAMNAA